MAKSAASPLDVLAFRPKITRPGTFNKPQNTGQRVQKPTVSTDDPRNSLKREVDSATTAIIDVKTTADIHTSFSYDLRGALETVTDVNRKLDPTTTTNEVIHEIFSLKLTNSLRRPLTTQKPSQDAVDLAHRRRAARMPIKKRHTKGQLRHPPSSNTIHSDSQTPDPGFKHTMIPNPSYRPPTHPNLPTYLLPPTASHIIVEEPISPPPETGKFVKIHYRRATTNATERITGNATTTKPPSDLTSPWKLDLAHLPQSYEQFKFVATSRVWPGVLGRPVSITFEIWRARGVWREGELKGWDCVGEIPFAASEGREARNGDGDECGDEAAVWKGFSVSEVYQLFCEEVQRVKLDLEEKSKWSGWHGKGGWDEWVAFSSQDVVGRVVVGFEEV